MRAPEELTALVDDGIIDQVLRPLMSGKEAQIYLVESGGRQCVAKVYKDAQHRSFKHRADYTEGRKVRNSRDQRAIDNRSRHGRKEDEASWRNTEVDTIYKLHYAGVRVPEPLHYMDGVLVMELVTDQQGLPAPRLGDVRFAPGEATDIYDFLIRQVVRMACAGVVHGDLSDFNVLIGAHGPVVIDFPQAVDPARNLNARKLLLRDVENLHRFVARFVPGKRRIPYGEEIWNLLEENTLTPETELTGRVRGGAKRVNTDLVMALVGEANRDEQRRRDRAAGGQQRTQQPRVDDSGRGPARGPAPSPAEGVRSGPGSLLRPSAPGAPGFRRRTEIVIPTSHHTHRAPTGDWHRSSAKPGAARPGAGRPGAGPTRSAAGSGPGSSRPSSGQARPGAVQARGGAGPRPAPGPSRATAGPSRPGPGPSRPGPGPSRPGPAPHGRTPAGQDRSGERSGGDSARTSGSNPHRRRPRRH